ncbi:Nardilysin [Nymphon striatum]|nr:Nardilysin [Nymphon striatum]
MRNEVKCFPHTLVVEKRLGVPRAYRSTKVNCFIIRTCVINIRSFETFGNLKKMVPLKSPNDKKGYRAFTLENGMKVLLISEPDSSDYEECLTSEEETSETESEKEECMDTAESCNESDDEDDEVSCKSEEKLAAASLCIGVGSFSDPDNSAGLAHYLEHMVFMGSEKYPKENIFDSYIEEHGGCDNAFTDSEMTCFHFEIIPKHLKKALDIFAQFFISPLLKIDSMDRELCAVNNDILVDEIISLSEYQQALPKDVQRKSHLLASLAKEGHPMRKFLYGNEYSLKTLPEKENVNIYEQLQQFRKKLYTAQFMTLVVQAKGNSCAYSNDLEKPFHYLNYLIEHEGKGSILSYLRKRVLALKLYSECDEDDGGQNNSTCSVFTICVTLTEDGFNNLFEVITVILEYLELLRREGPCERVAKEVQKILENCFVWQEEEPAYDNAQELSCKMQLYPVEDYIVGSYKMDYDPKLIKMCQDYLTYENMNIFVSSSKFCNESANYEKEKWFDVPYSKCEIDPVWKKSWENLKPRSELHLPAVNEFIASDFTLVKHSKAVNEYPLIVHDDYRGKLWYKGDTKFKLPKACIVYSLESKIVYESAKSAGMMDLFVSILTQNLETELFAAKLADLDYSVTFDCHSLIIKANGFNEKLKILFLIIINAVVNFDMEEDFFNGIKDELIREYHNNCTTLKQLAREATTNYVEEIYFNSADKKRGIELVTKSDLLAFLKKFKSKLYIQGLVQGNILENDSIDLHKKIIETLCCDDKDIERVKLRCIKMERNAELYRLKNLNEDDSNSAVCNYYQFGPCTMNELAFIELLVAFMREPCFDILRTKEQLSYSTSSKSVNLRGVYGITIKVWPNAEKFSCVYVDKRIETFIDEFLKYVAALEEKKFQNQVESEIKLLQQVDLTLLDEVDRNWNEILSNNFVFDRRQKLIKSMESVSLTDFQTWCKENLSASGKIRQSKVSVQAIGKGSQETINVEIPAGNDQIQWLVVPSPVKDDYIEIYDMAEHKMTKEFYSEHKIL